MAEVPWLGRLVASRYRLIARLGEDAISELYLARHVLIDRLSAIKVLRSEMGRDRGLRKLFLREGKAVNRINHPNIVEISDYGETEDTAYLVMEYVPGEPLSRHLSTGAIGWQRACRIGLQIALALSRAHEMGVIHRDIKPANVLVIQRRGGDDIVKLTDFGVAKLLDSTSAISMPTTGLVPSQLTPGYVAPEMRMLGRLDARSDIFSLGVLVYEAACGTLPYPVDASPANLQKPRTIRDLLPDAPRSLEALFERLLAPDPEDRPRDAFEAVAAFRAVLDDASHLEPEETEPPTERLAPRPYVQQGPRLLTMPFDQIAPLCVRAFDTICVAADDAIVPVDHAGLRKASELCTMLQRLHDLVTVDAEALAALEVRARAIRSELGARLDALGRDRSRAMGWASSVAERTDYVRAQRLSGAQPIQAMDALLWEEASLEHEEEASIDHADDLAREIDDLSARLDAANEAIEGEKSKLEAQLEGHAAALRALAGEAWMLLDGVAGPLGVSLSTESL